jgi:hypothetical protein
VRETLRFPLPVPARLAVVDADFHLATNMKAFAVHDIRGLADYAPEALALPLGSALALADQKLHGRLDLPSLKLAIVVFSSLDLNAAGPLGGHHRDLLWKAFGLPVFEQLRGWDGRVFARECEVHDGLHFEEALLTLHSAETLRVPCDCGKETPRLRHLTAAKARSAAA